MSTCAKPRCSGGGSVVLSFDYAAREAQLHDMPAFDVSPHLYILCHACAESMTAPRGWHLIDDRSRSAQLSLSYSA